MSFFFQNEEIFQYDKDRSKGHNGQIQGPPNNQIWDNVSNKVNDNSKRL